MHQVCWMLDRPLSLLSLLTTTTHLSLSVSNNPPSLGASSGRRRLRQAPTSAFTTGDDSDSDNEGMGAAPLRSTTTLGPIELHAPGSGAGRQAAARLHPLVALTAASEASTTVLLRGRRLVLGERVGYTPAVVGRKWWRRRETSGVASGKRKKERCSCVHE
jgi:hypothetical protein